MAGRGGKERVEEKKMRELGALRRCYVNTLPYICAGQSALLPSVSPVRAANTVLQGCCLHPCPHTAEINIIIMSWY